MKTALLTLITLMLFSVRVLAATSVTLAWDASPAAEGVTSYHIYEKLSAATWVKIGQVAGNKTTFVVADVSPGVHTYAVTAANIFESPKSNEASVPAPPGAPKNLRVVVEVQVQ